MARTRKRMPPVGTGRARSDGAQAGAASPVAAPTPGPRSRTSSRRASARGCASGPVAARPGPELATTAVSATERELQSRLVQRFPSDDESRTQLAAAVGNSAVAMAETLAAFFLAAGVSRDEVAAVFRAVGAGVTEREMQFFTAPSPAWSQLSTAVATWWRDPAYLDDEGRPQALQEHGPAPSVDALLRSCVDAPLRTEAKELLRRSVATVVDGQWTCEEERGFLAVSGNDAVQRLMVAWSGMLATFVDNQIRRRDPPMLKNFDCMAHVPDFPARMIPELRAKIGKRLQMVLHDIDTWMTNAAEARDGGPVAMVGVTAFLHTSPVAGTRRPRTPTRSR